MEGSLNLETFLRREKSTRAGVRRPRFQSWKLNGETTQPPLASGLGFSFSCKTERSDDSDGDRAHVASQGPCMTQISREDIRVPAYIAPLGNTLMSAGVVRDRGAERIGLCSSSEPLVSGAVWSLKCGLLCCRVKYAPDSGDFVPKAKCKIFHYCFSIGFMLK